MALNGRLNSYPTIPVHASHRILQDSGSSNLGDHNSPDTDILEMEKRHRTRNYGTTYEVRAVLSEKVAKSVRKVRRPG
jgi:hypothetical protein